MNVTLENRVLGSLYGMATGDALGVPSSTYPQQQVKDTWGWIDAFYPPAKGHIFHDGLKAGEYTDDTEQALALIHSFLKHKKVVPHDVVEEIIKWADRVKGKYASPLGPSTERALKAIRAGADIHTSGLYGNTNGSAMRISPVGIIHGIRRSGCEELVKDVYLTCMPTHNTDVCVSSAAAIARGVAVCLMGETDLDKIVEETVKAAELGTKYGNKLCAPSVAKRIIHACRIVKAAETPEQALKDLYDIYAGMDLAADSIPVAIALFVLGEGDVKKVNEYCVNFGGDCDTNAAMAGAMAGAYSGIETVPSDWVETINRVNQIDLSVYVPKLIELAKEWTVAEV